MYNSQNIQVALSELQNEAIKTNENRNGFYRAIVISNKDPYNIARVKIRIPCFHGTSSAQSFYVTDDNLPYAWPATFNGANFQSGQYLIPLEGSTVWVSFETGTNNILYFGSLYSTAPTSEKYLYFDRTTNHGESKLITEDDIPSDYNTNKYVLYRSPKGASIYIDDRDMAENITIEDIHGNSIKMNKNGVLINSEEYLSAKFPYLMTYFINNGDVDNDNIVFNVDYTKVFDSIEMESTIYKFIEGARVLYIDNGDIVGSGILLNGSKVSNQLQIGTTGFYNKGGQGVPGTDNYNKLKNRPSINEVVLEGNINLPDTPITNLQLEDMLK